MSQEPNRQSKRTKTVNKRLKLEEKLEKRRIEAEIRTLKARSKRIQDLQVQELDLYVEEARKHSELLDRFYPDVPVPDNLSEHNQSLEWDSNEDATSPSFVKSSPDRDRNVEEIIQNILSSSPEENPENCVSRGKFEREINRRKTSTDNDFLESSPVDPHQEPFQWPPRYPSQEPEDSLLLQSLDLAKVVQPPLEVIEDESEVFEAVANQNPEALDKALTTMDETSYKARVRAVKLAERKVKDVKKRFLAQDLTSIHVPEYRDRLKEIRDKLDAYDDAASDVIVDLDEADATDKQRKIKLEADQEILLKEVLANEKEVQTKIKELMESIPLTKAEQESLDLKRKQFQIAEKKEEDAKIEKGQRIEIDMKGFSQRVETLGEVIDKVKSAKELSDLEIKSTLPEAKKWEAKLDDLAASKVKLDKDMVGVKVDTSAVQKLNDDFASLATNVKIKLGDLMSADHDRCLFSLTKPVKEVAVYPPPFGGNASENVYKFREKITEAIQANQIREKDKPDIVRKYLKGFAKEITGDTHKTFEGIMKVLIDTFGAPFNTWETRMENFKRKCTNPKGWSNIGSQERLGLVAKTCEFLREAEQLASDYKELETDIYSKGTIDAVIQVIPPIISDKIWEMTKDSVRSEWKEIFGCIKTQMDVEHKKTVNASKHFKAIKENTASYNACVNNLDDKRNTKPPGKFKNKPPQHLDHDCKQSRTCNTKWGGLGCSELYKFHTVQERCDHLKAQRLCFRCGLRFHGTFTKGPNCVWGPEMIAVKCTPTTGEHCQFSAATCNKHQAAGNASRELKSWLDRMNIQTTVSSIFSFPCQNKGCSIPQNTKVSGKVRSKLQSGLLSSDFSNDQLQEFFTHDLEAQHNKTVEVKPIPEGEVAFVFCKIKGKESDVQAFIDNGCNCAILKDGIPQREFNSCMLRKGPIQIDVATGVQVEAQGEWGTVLPLNDGSYQVLRCLTVPRVTSQMPTLHLRALLGKIKSDNKSHKNFKSIQNIQVPQMLGGEIDMILGIQFASVYPEEVFSLPSGLKIYKSKFLPAKKGELACIGGPLGALDSIVANTSARSCVRYLANLLTNYSNGYAPKIDFFPSSDFEMERGLDRFVDKGIPDVDEYLDSKAIVESESDDEEAVQVHLDTETTVDSESDEEEEEVTETNKEDVEVADQPAQPHSCLDVDLDAQPVLVHCSDCGDQVYPSSLTISIQSELKKFIQQQEAGLDASFRCVRCRECKQCLKGAGMERMSMRQEAEQEIIRQSVSIDRNLGRAIAKLPFLTDPSDKLKDNSRVAAKRLENVCRKYSHDEDVKQMLNKSMKKLMDNGHIVLLDDLPPEQRNRILNSKSSYTIPADVAFKEGSVSTPARWVFDAGSKTALGYSLNDLLAKGAIDMVRLVDMVMDWRMGPSAFSGDIRQFYNSILLSEEHWIYQKVLIKKDLDPQSKTLIGIIRTLIYGVAPVGNQCEEVIKLLADIVWNYFPDVAKLLLFKRYVDDFGQSTVGKDETKELIEKTTQVLKMIQMVIKGWAESGIDPPADISEDGVSVGFAGMTWFPKGDFYKLNIQSLHFSKKKRGKFPSDLVKFENTKGVSVEEFTPKEITRTNCTSVTARIYDIQGLLAPLTLKLKNDLRTLISYEPSWTQTIPDHQRAIWINNFKTIEEIRDILYLRCSIPSDAVSCQARILLLCDAARPGIILGAYTCYERPNDEWSCDLLFGKGLLAQENWTIPQKELHGMSALSNLKVILETSLDSWIKEFLSFGDSEIALSWIIYEKVKLTTFIRNRVINIRTKMGLDILHHVEGKNNPTDVGTRPEEITAESVKPGSVWLKGKPWMNMSMKKAKEIGVIKHVDEIKLTNDKKKTFKEGIIFDTFDDTGDAAVFGVAKIGKIDKMKVAVREVKAEYLFPPLKRSFKSLVRVTALVLVAISKFKKLLIKKQIERGEKSKLDMKALDFKPPIFTVFQCSSKPDLDEDDLVNATQTKEKLTEYFSIQGIALTKTSQNHKIITLDEKQLSGALENLFKKATSEVKAFNDPKQIDKVAIEQNGILFSKSRLLESAELRAVGHLADTINLESFTGVNYKVPMLDKHSPLAISIANHLHYVKFPHKGAETLHRLSLQFCNMMGGRKLFTQLSADCFYCKKLQKKLLEQIMGPLSDSQLTISPVFFYTLVDLWGPLTAYVPGYEKVTRSTSDKPHQIYVMVFACGATGTVNCQIIEGKDTGFCLDGFNRFFCETTVPKIVFTDEEGGLVKALKEAKVDIADLAGNLSTQRGIQFQTVVPQGHSAHGKIEKKIHLLQQSLERSGIRNSRCTATGWMCIMKLIERSVNSIPIGYLYHQSGGSNPLLRILTPNNLKLITTGDRAPVGLFNIPDKPGDIMEKIEEKYFLWYKVWNEFYLPLIMQRKKWHERSENLVSGDIVYFKLTESKMSADWRAGKVEEVKIGEDGYVRKVRIAYKDTSAQDSDDWIHRTVDRPVRNIVKIFSLDETSFMDDINDVHKLAEKMMNGEDVSNLEAGDTFPNRFQDSNAKPDPFAVTNSDDDEDSKHSNDDNELDENYEPPEASPHPYPKPSPKPIMKRKRRTEIDNLEIKMSGWENETLMTRAAPFIHNTFQAQFTTQLMDNVYEYEETCGASYDEGQETMYETGIGEDPEKEFNFVIKNENLLDMNNQLYLL